MDESKHEALFQRMAIDFKQNGTQWGRLKNFAEVPLFADSRVSRALQIADHVAYSLFRRYEYGDTSYLDIISHRFDAENRQVHGLVHLDKDIKRTCRCIACLSRI